MSYDYVDMRVATNFFVDTGYDGYCTPYTQEAHGDKAQEENCGCRLNTKVLMLRDKTKMHCGSQFL